MRNHILIFMVMACLFLSCSDDPVDMDVEKPLVPLAVGNFWKYQQVEYDLIENHTAVLDTMTFAITRSYWHENIGGKRTNLFVLKQYNSEGELQSDSSTVFNQGLSYMMIDGGGRLLPNTRMIARYPVSKGETWNYGQCYSATCDSVGVEIITPLGTFECYQIVYYWNGDCPEEVGPPRETQVLPDAGCAGDYYTPGVGRVVAGAGATTINGTTIRRWELIAYKVK